MSTMTRMYGDFENALADFRTSGGAMNYYSASSHGAESWEVGDTDIIGEMSEQWDERGDGDENAARTAGAKALTIAALEAGGLTQDQINDELADWVD